MNIEQPRIQTDIAPVCLPAKFIITFAILSSFKQCTSTEEGNKNNSEVTMGVMEFVNSHIREVISWNLSTLKCSL